METARGCRELKKHSLGDRLTLRQMILAKCADCCNWYADGKNDCEIPDCPLYPLSPYGTHPKYTVFKSRASHQLSAQHLKALTRGRARVKKDNSCSIGKNMPTEASFKAISTHI